MSIKISANQSMVAYHVVQGPVTFPYAVDAHRAVGAHPVEWSLEPWSREGRDRGVKMIRERHARETEEALARKEAKDAGNLPLPPSLPEEIELSPEDEQALDEYNRSVEEAADRLRAHREKKAAEKAAADQVAADEALVKSEPPAPVKRPFGRKGEPTPAELDQIKKRDAKKAADDKMVADKAEQDKIAAFEASGAKITS